LPRRLARRAVEFTQVGHVAVQPGPNFLAKAGRSTGSISINIGSRESEGILDQLELRFRFLGDEHLYHIKPKENVRIVQQTQPGESPL